MNTKCSRLLEETSRTFLVPIMRMPGKLKHAVSSAYLCLRAIDEIEDQNELAPEIKIHLLNSTAELFQSANGSIDGEAFTALFEPHKKLLPEVTLSIAEVAELSPTEVRHHVYGITADMAKAMAFWVERNWNVKTRQDLDRYTFDVAGRVGILLSKLWKWYDGTECNDELAIGFGRALQTVNIVRNRDEDLLQRNVDFFPDGWNRERMIAYARDQISMADEYMTKLSPGVVYDFCCIPLELAKATLRVIEEGIEKLTRQEVNSLIAALNLSKSD